MEAINDYLAGDKRWFNEKFPDAPKSVIQKLDKLREEIKNTPTEYFESVSDRAVKLNEFEKALIPEGLPKAQREAIVAQLNAEGIQPRFYRNGERQQALIDLMEEDNLTRQPKQLATAASTPFKDQVGAIGKNIRDDSAGPLEALKQEARKYKTAEGFVKAKTNAYHGTLS